MNIHLFHDDDNLVALETVSTGHCLKVLRLTFVYVVQSPSVYSCYRKQALKFALDSVFSSLDNNAEPLYIYGDFNFRLDFSAVVKVW